MYGAIIGDIVGSRFEFLAAPSNNFDFFTEENKFTDDTVMTVAIADALMKAGKNASQELLYECVAESLKRWGKAYPWAGYGGRFNKWFNEENALPYNSYGNGSAMRVSAAGWLYNTMDDTIKAAKTTAEVTHNHPEGIKGAECTAAVIFLLRNGISKKNIKPYIKREFGYSVPWTFRAASCMNVGLETCQDTLPKALFSLYKGRTFEDVVRIAVSLGGDTDTVAAVASSMAEAIYPIPRYLIDKANSYLPDEIVKVIESFEEFI